mgnify:FL=1
MNKVKVRFITILSLCAALLVSLAFGAWAAFAGRIGADAEITGVDYAPTSVFASGTGGDVGASEGTDSYVQFTFTDGGNTYFRRDLAYKWFTAAPAETQSTLANPGVANYLSMEFAFASADFELYTIGFESTEENVSKEGKSVNSLLFRPTAAAEGGLEVAVRSASQQDTDLEELSWTAIAENATDALGDIRIDFAESAAGVGNFDVHISVNGEQKTTGTFTNIGGNYAEYRSSSSSTPNTPITFTMELAEDSEANEAQVLMKRLNGQSFQLTDGLVKDNTAPVLAVNEDVYAFRLGQRYNFTAYEAIDVCDDSVSVTRSYYMAKQNDDGTYDVPDESATGDDSSYESLTTSTFFMPTASTPDELGTEYVSIRFNLDDGRGRDDANRVNEYVYLSWYAADTTEDGGIVATLPTQDGEGDETVRRPDFIVVTPDEQEGPYFTGVKADTDAGKNVYEDEEAFNDAADAYQEAVNDAAAAATAGSGAYLYLPSLRGLIGSNYADYRDLSFTIFYWHESQEVGSSPSSESSLSYNNLRFEVDQEGTYTFRIIAEDSAGNEMYLYNTDGTLVALSSSTIGYDSNGEDFQISEDYLPVFTATIGYNGASIEDPGSQDYGYRDRSYSVEDFEVIALEGYASDYSLYYFDTSRLAEGQTAPTYSECVENAQTLFFAENAPYANCIVPINVYNDDVTEDDEEWEDTDNDYAWDPESSLSFTPQESGIYFVGLTVTEQTGATVSSYMAIEVRNPVDIIPGVSQWLQNNTVSVVLFSISAVLAVIIIVLFVVKPSDKTVEEVDLEKLKGRKTKKK